MTIGDSLWRRAKARNARLRIFYGGLFTLSTLLLIIYFIMTILSISARMMVETMTTKIKVARQDTQLNAASQLSMHGFDLPKQHFNFQHKREGSPPMRIWDMASEQAITNRCDTSRGFLEPTRPSSAKTWRNSTPYTQTSWLHKASGALRLKQSWRKPRTGTVTRRLIRERAV